MEYGVMECGRNSFHYSMLHHSSRRSSNRQPPFALFEKRTQRRQIIFSGAQRDLVDVVPAQCPGKVCFVVFRFLA